MSCAPSTMRSAIVHDWFQGFHGSERTVAAMLDLFERDPDIFTFHAARELLPERLAAAIVARVPPGAPPGSTAAGTPARADGAGCCPTCRATSRVST